MLSRCSAVLCASISQTTSSRENEVVCEYRHCFQINEPEVLVMHFEKYRSQGMLRVLSVEC